MCLRAALEDVSRMRRSSFFQKDGEGRKKVGSRGRRVKIESYPKKRASVGLREREGGGGSKSKACIITTLTEGVGVCGERWQRLKRVKVTFTDEGKKNDKSLTMGLLSWW